ncbi:unnamed protein product [Meganyctiphanes norvegica]|uniref:Uncharacterized protein n=1 Tax=Meganyctiphanes norvegica TaxID=48144 RepID=A0AAV2QTU0_MEGNR
MFFKILILTAFIHLECSALPNVKQKNFLSNNVDTSPTLKIIGLGSSNVTFTWTRTGEWKDVDETNFTVSLLPREGTYRPIEYNYSFSQFFDFHYNLPTSDPNYFCDEDSCICRFTGHLAALDNLYYKSCSDGVVLVEAGDFTLSANFTTAPSQSLLGVSSKLDGNDLTVQWNGYNASEDGVCGRHLMLNIYQPWQNPGFTPVGWYWPGTDYYGNLLHQRNLSADMNLETNFSFPLDPKLVTDDVKTQTVGAILAYMDGDVVTNSWSYTGVNYKGNSQSPAASTSAATIVLAALLALAFNL